MQFLEFVGSWNIYDTSWCNICTLSLWGSWWLNVYFLSLLSLVSQPCPSQEVQIWQTTIPISWNRQETWLATITVKVCTQGLYAVFTCYWCETGFAVKLKGQRGDVKAVVPFESSHYHHMYDLSSCGLLNEEGPLSVFVMAD